VQKSVGDESAGRKLPAQDRAYSIEIGGLIADGHRKEAEQKLNEWESKHPMAKVDSDFLVLRARLLMLLGRWKEAVMEIESFEKMQPDSPYQIEGDFYRARALFETGQKDEARKMWTEIVTKYPKHEFAQKSKEWLSKK
jgi:TolA-binding protein